MYNPLWSFHNHNTVKLGRSLQIVLCNTRVLSTLHLVIVGGHVSNWDQRVYCRVQAVFELTENKTVHALLPPSLPPSLPHLSSKLRGEWEERVKVIGSLEQSLAEVQETFSQREASLAKEKEEAVQRARYCVGFCVVKSKGKALYGVVCCEVHSKGKGLYGVLCCEVHSGTVWGCVL